MAYTHKNFKVEGAQASVIDDRIYLDVIYRYEDDKVVKQIHLPKVEVPIVDGALVLETIPAAWKDHSRPVLGDRSATAVRLSEPRLYLCHDEHGISYYETVIREKMQEMTLDEIEKKLGYKIKIVNKK